MRTIVGMSCPDAVTIAGEEVMKYISTNSTVRGGLLVSTVMLLIATLAGAPAFAKSDAKKSKPQKAPVERDSDESFDTRFALLYGTKSLEKKDWAPVEKHTGLGAEVEFAKPDWPASVVITYFTAESKKTEQNVDFGADGIAAGEFTGATTELGIGARKVLESSSDTLRFYVEGGAAQISGKFSGKNLTSGVSASDTAATIGY